MWGKSPLLVLVAALALSTPPIAAGRVISPWGSGLSATPTVDTANGASRASGDRPTRREISPYPHDGADIALWNTRVAHGTATAPRGGQVRAVRLKGCAVQDRSAPSQLSLGIPVNAIEFQTLTRLRAGAYRATATAGLFQLPFCSDGADPARGRISTATVTTFRPVHMCIGRGDTVGLYGLGGFVPSPVGLGWYPEGVPFEILAGVRGSASNAFVDADLSRGTYSPGARPRGPHSGWGREPRLELMLQVLEGVGADAYGLCPGGTAEESTSSNAVVCAVRPPYDGHRRCGRAPDSGRRMSSG